MRDVFGKLCSERQGELCIGSGIALWALFPVLTKLGTAEINPILAAGFATTFASFVFALFLTIRGTWSQLLIREAWIPILIAALLIGVGYHGLLFYGIERSSANTSSIIMLTEAFVSACILRAVGKEFLTQKQMLGGVCIVIGAAIVVAPEEFSLAGGEIYILLSQFFPPLGNYAMQRARLLVSSVAILFVRSLVSGIFLCVLGVLLYDTDLGRISSSGVLVLFLNGFIALGVCKILWVEAIHRIPISKAVAIGAVSPIVTMLYSYLILSEEPTLFQIGGLPPVMLGLYLLTRKSITARYQ